MTGRMRVMLMVGGVLVVGALGTAFTKKKVEDDAYYGVHLAAAHSKLGERRARAAKMALPTEPVAFAPSWGEGEDMWPILMSLRQDLTDKKIWPEATNYPSSRFVYSIATQQMPDLEPRLMSLANCTTCQSINDMDKGALSAHSSTSTARGVTRLLAAKADQEVSRKQWSKAAETLRLADHIARVAATGPNRDGMLTWSGNLLSLHRKMLIVMAQGHTEPERLALYREFLLDESRMPDMVPAVNFEYYTRYWAAVNYAKLTPDEIREIVVFSPSEDIPPPTHHASSEAMVSSVLDAWAQAVEGAQKHPKDPIKAGIAADQPFIDAYLRKTESDYILVTMDMVFEQTGTIMARALDTRRLAYASIETIRAELAGQPLRDMDMLVTPQNDYDGRKFVRTKTSDGWVISLEDTKNPTAQPYGLSDRVTDNVLAFRWKSRKTS